MTAADSRKVILDGLRERPEISVLILGGGINGLGVFRELALQGVECLVVDRDDFVAGASSKSSRMIHGGLRYLENREFRLVRESLRERNRLLENAPHYVTPLRTTIPLFSLLGGVIKSPLVFLGLPARPGGRGALVVKFGLWFYDFVTRKQRMTPTHFFTGREESLRQIPGLNPAIRATATYWDACITQAERLCIELMHDARERNPGCRALNYAAVDTVEGGDVRIRDRMTGEAVTVRPRVVVNATGAWVDRTNEQLGLSTRFMGGTKGSHIVVENRRLAGALGDRMVYYEHADGRVCIAFAFMGKVIMGSTDIPVDDPDAARCDGDEISYMLATLAGVIPGIPVTRGEIVYTFCGVRPLPAARADVPGKVSRDHRIEEAEPDGLRTFPVLSLVGGKWTTFRALAEQAADQVLSRLGGARVAGTQHEPIGGGRDYPADREQWIDEVAGGGPLDRERVAVLLDRYGTGATRYIASLGKRRETPLDSLPGYTRDEIAWIAGREYLVHFTDLVCRRSIIALLGDGRQDVLTELAAAAGAALGWDAPRREREVDQALRELAF
jgi:glycerol-3-phosphate dehydrogenase